MDILKIILLSSSSLIVLFIISKIIGNREITQLSLFDYIISISIGSIAAEMATALDDNFIEPLIAMIVYALLASIIVYIERKSIKARKFISGTSIVLIDNGTIYKNNLKKAQLDINELIMEARIKGFFNMADIQTAIFEANGEISFLPKVEKRPATPEDLNLTLPQEKVVITVISDGVLLEKNLKLTGNDKTWLEEELKRQQIPSINTVFLATCDSNNNLSVYPKYELEHNISF